MACFRQLPILRRVKYEAQLCEPIPWDQLPTNSTLMTDLVY